MASKTTLTNLFPYTSTNPNTLLMTSKQFLSYTSTLIEIALVCPSNNILLTKLELCKMTSIELVTTEYSKFAVDFNHINIVVVHTYHKHFFIFFASFINLGSYSHFFIHAIYLFSIIYFIFTSYRPCSVTLTRDWLISYLASHSNLPFCIYSLYITHTLHTDFP